MSGQLTVLIERYARRAGLSLPPGWKVAELVGEVPTPDDLETVAFALGWHCEILKGRPQAQNFPLLVFDPDQGWMMSHQWCSDHELLVDKGGGEARVEYRPEMICLRLIERNKDSRDSGTALGVFWAAVFGRKAAIIDAGIATVVINVVALATSFYSMQVYDRVIPHNGFSTLIVLTGGMLFALLVDGLIRYTRAITVDREASKIDGEVSAYFYERMQAVRMDARPRSIGTMAAQLRGLDQVRSLMSAASLFLIADLPFALLFMAMMALVGGKVALVPLLVFPLSLGLALVMARFIKSDTDIAQVSGNRKNGLLVEALDAAETIKANHGGWHMLAAWNRLVGEVHHHDLRVKRWSSLSSTGFNFLQQASYVAVVFTGVYQVSEGLMTMGGVIACSILVGRVNGPLVAALPNFVIQWGYARSSLRALDSVLQMPTDRPLDGSLMRLHDVTANLRAEGVEFAHPGMRSGIRVPNLTINPGERVGVLGPVGSGKSTLLRLLSGLYAPIEGVILLDNVDIRQIAEDDVRRHVFYLAQDYKLIKGTLRDNLTLGLGALEDADIALAAHKTGLLDFIKQHPLGVNLPIAEGGTGLSGGQRAQVGLTRAILSKAKIWLLDEPTANLDRDTEVRVLQAINEAQSADTALVIVTHKLQLVNQVQRLLVVANGQVAIDGPTEAVLAELQRRTQAARQTPPASPVAQR